MSYSLDDKISKYLADHGVERARVEKTTVLIPKGDAWIQRVITGVVTKSKLDAIISELKETDYALQTNA